MVMIDLGDEKKSLGVISVTRVTETLHARHRRHPARAAFAQFTGDYAQTLGVRGPKLPAAAG